MGGRGGQIVSAPAVGKASALASISHRTWVPSGRHRGAQRRLKNTEQSPGRSPSGTQPLCSGEPAFSQIQEVHRGSSSECDLYPQPAESAAAHVEPETAACAPELVRSGLPLKLSSGWPLWTLVISLLGPPCPGCALACTVLLPGTSVPLDARRPSGSSTAVRRAAGAEGTEGTLARKSKGH